MYYGLHISDVVANKPGRKLTWVHIKRKILDEKPKHLALHVVGSLRTLQISHPYVAAKERCLHSSPSEVTVEHQGLTRQNIKLPVVHTTETQLPPLPNQTRCLWRQTGGSERVGWEWKQRMTTTLNDWNEHSAWPRFLRMWGYEEEKSYQ